MIQSHVQNSGPQERTQDPEPAAKVVAAAQSPILTLIWSEDSVSSSEIQHEQDLAALELGADQAMTAALDLIAETTADLTRCAAEAQLAQVAADNLQAEMIADCAVQTAAAIQLSNQAAARRTAWVASEAARRLAIQTSSGDELAAETAARQQADLVARIAQARAAGWTRGADLAATNVAAAVAEVGQSVAMLALATRLGACNQESALGGIAFNAAAQRAINAADRPPLVS